MRFLELITSSIPVQMILEGPISNPQYRRWHLFAADNRKDSIEMVSIQRGAQEKIKSIEEVSSS